MPPTEGKRASAGGASGRRLATWSGGEAEAGFPVETGVNCGSCGTVRQGVEGTESVLGRREPFVLGVPVVTPGLLATRGLLGALLDTHGTHKPPPPFFF